MKIISKHNKKDFYDYPGFNHTQKYTDHLKIISHGFDLKTSFRKM